MEVNFIHGCICDLVKSPKITIENSVDHLLYMKVCTFCGSSRLAWSPLSLLSGWCGGSLLVVKWVGNEADHSPAFNVEIKVHGAVFPFPPCVLVLCLSKHEDNFAFLLLLLSLTACLTNYSLIIWMIGL
jgi:hypothetical protein